MRAIFISYRRNDSEGEAGRLFDDLVREFGEDSVFMDVTAIEAGRDFRKAIDESVASCGVLLAVIGKNWLEAKDDKGGRRLDDPMDFVRLETASALKRDIPVIPVIVRGALMPRSEHLPDDLRDLAYRNFVELTHARWTSDLQLLITTLRRQLGDQKSGAIRAVTEVEAPSETESSQTETGERPKAVPTFSPSDHKDKRRRFLSVAIALCIVAAAIATFVFYPRQVTVPNVRGETLAQATDELLRAHLKVGQTTLRDDLTKDANVVLSQYPPSDEQVKRGTAVDLVIVRPAALVEVPAVTGQSLESAQRSLSDRHLTLGDVERQPRAGMARDIVLQAFPQPGEMVKNGAKIDLLVSDAPPETKATASTATAAETANENWAAQRAAQRAATKRAAALKAAADKAAADKVAADKTAADKAAADKAAADKAAAQAAAARPRVTIRSASCTTVKPGQYRVDLAGDAYAPANDQYLFYVWVAVGDNGTRWRPACASWSVPAAGEDPLADVTCIHRPTDASQTTWQTSRIITSKDKQAPNNGGTAIFKMGAHSASTLKFNLTCQ